MKTIEQQKCYLRATVDIWDILSEPGLGKTKCGVLSDLGYPTDIFDHNCPLCSMQFIKKKAKGWNYKDCKTCPLIELWGGYDEDEDEGPCENNKCSPYRKYRANLGYRNNTAKRQGKIIADAAYQKLLKLENTEELENEMKRVIISRDKSTIELNEVAHITPIFAKKEGKLMGMLVNDSEGWILMTGGKKGWSGHHPRRSSLIQNALVAGITFHIE